MSEEKLDSIRLAAVEPKTPPYTKEQLYELGFKNISNRLIYETFLNKVFVNSDSLENKCDIVVGKNNIAVAIEYWKNGLKGNFSLTWVKENDEWCISRFVNNLPNYK